MFNIVCTLISLFLKKPTSFNTRKITMHWDHVCTNANKSHTNTDALERRGWGRNEEEREMQMAHSLILRMLDQEKQSLPEHSSNARNHFFLGFLQGNHFLCWMPTMCTCTEIWVWGQSWPDRGWLSQIFQITHCTSSFSQSQSSEKCACKWRGFPLFQK